MHDKVEAMATFSEQLRFAQDAAMTEDNTMLCFGLGIDDPKAIFNTTQGLAEKFGEDRVFDMPTSENAMTGIGIGAALSGSRVLMTHQRLDFFLLALDQLVNNAAKWHYMFNGQMKVPLTIRLIIGRGWGQGPTHAQNLQSWFAHIPGLKVVVPSRAEVVAQQLYQALLDDNPVLFIEHRWLHQQECMLDSTRNITAPFKTTELLHKGNDLTLVANGLMTIEALKAARFLQQEYKVSCDVLDLAGMHDIDWKKLQDSVAKTGHLIVCESARTAFSCASEVVAHITEHAFSSLQKAPTRIGLPDYPEPTSFGLTETYYPDANTIVRAVLSARGIAHGKLIEKSQLHDVPGDWFKGPF